VTRPPDFEGMMEGIEEPEDRERLRRVHELLIEAGPPPELSPALASVPLPKERRRSRRRLIGGLALAGAVVAATFGVGYLAGNSGDDEAAAPMPIRETISLGSDRGASGAVELGFRGSDGNWPMLVTVRGLEPLRGGDYYTLALTKDGKPIVTCGTFNVGGRQTKTIRMNAAYNLDRFDGWVVLRYDAETHDDTPVLWTPRAAAA
jgi:hypothetical protein